jgi:hypothetical protein
MKYELFFSGIALVGFAYMIYKTREWTNFTPKQQYSRTAEKLNSVAIMLMSVSAGLFFIAKSLLL